MVLAALALLAMPKEVILPAEYVNGRVYLAVRLNGRANDFVLDTGASMSCLDLGYAGAVGAKLTKSVNADGNGGTVRASFIENAKCEIGSETQAIQVAVPLKHLSRLEGRNLDGILGGDFIGRFVVAIDYENSRVVLNPASRFDGEPVPCEFDSMRPTIQIQVKLGGRNYKVKALVDSGASNALDLTAAFTSKHPELSTLPGGEPMLATGGVGGMSLGRYVRGDELRIGNRALAAPVVLLSLATRGLSGKASNYDAVIGGETLRRFTLVADYPHKKLIFAPNSSIDTPFVADCSGLSIACKPEDLRRFVIRYVAPNSPASRAGLRVGDEITALDDRQAASFSLYQLREALRQSGKTVRLSTPRSTVEMTLHELY